MGKAWQDLNSTTSSVASGTRRPSTKDSKEQRRQSSQGGPRKVQEVEDIEESVSNGDEAVDDLEESVRRHLAEATSELVAQAAASSGASNDETSTWLREALMEEFLPITDSLMEALVTGSFETWLEQLGAEAPGSAAQRSHFEELRDEFQRALASELSQEVVKSVCTATVSAAELRVSCCARASELLADQQQEAQKQKELEEKEAREQKEAAEKEARKREAAEKEAQKQKEAAEEEAEKQKKQRMELEAADMEAQKLEKSQKQKEAAEKRAVEEKAQEQKEAEKKESEKQKDHQDQQLKDQDRKKQEEKAENKQSEIKQQKPQQQEGAEKKSDKNSEKKQDEKPKAGVAVEKTKAEPAEEKTPKKATPTADFFGGGPATAEIKASDGVLHSDAQKKAEAASDFGGMDAF
eukprot:TRINITY_DN13464_c0_g1_i1.p1 TRINITY_DN13464_c0_g1~~TRINITY_DN13464_c0_g1_i1.p1  ORF type:complete len:409 (-),score=146.96 TRINITY_DN13464_c0_g1_i1:119-1345(-)